MDAIRRTALRAPVAAVIAVSGLIALSGCQTAVPEPAPVVYEDPYADQQRLDAAAEQMRERHAGRPADRVAEQVAADAAQAQATAERFSGRPVDRIVEELERDAQGG